MVFVALTIVWLLVMVAVNSIVDSKSAIHEILVVLMGLGLWSWLATIYVSYRLNDERKKITEILEKLREAQEHGSQRETMSSCPSKIKSRR